MAIDPIKRKKKTIYRARVVLKSKRRLTKCFARKVDAEHWEAKVKVENADPMKVRREPIRFSELTVQFLKFSKSDFQPATYQRYETIIRKYLVAEFGDTLVDSISKMDIMNFKAKLMELPLAQGTKYFVFTAVRTIFRKGQALDLTSHDPTLGIKSPKKGAARTEYWTEKEASLFLSRMRLHPRLPLYLIALNTGMRAGEIFGLQWDCVDFENKLIRIRRTFDQKTLKVKETTKTHKARSIGINDALLDLLKKLNRNSISGSVLKIEDLGCKDPSHLARTFYADCKSAGVRLIKFHDLRHTFATQLVRNGGTIHEAANILGHSTTNMTERYAHFGDEHAVQAAKKVSFTAEDTGAKVIPLRAV